MSFEDYFNASAYGRYFAGVAVDTFGNVYFAACTFGVYVLLRKKFAVNASACAFYFERCGVEVLEPDFSAYRICVKIIFCYSVFDLYSSAC